MFTIKLDNFIMEQLKCQEVRHYIADTNKGALTLMLRKGETKYIFVLDAVPVEKDVHDELMAVLFPIKENVVPQVQKEPVVKDISQNFKEGIAALDTGMKEIKEEIKAKKRGRPFGTKNK